MNIEDAKIIITNGEYISRPPFGFYLFQDKETKELTRMDYINNEHVRGTERSKYKFSDEDINSNEWIKVNSHNLIKILYKS